MEITLLLDHNLGGYAAYLTAGFKETGWDEHLRVRFTVLSDYGLPDDYPDDEIWRFVQTQRILLLTHNRNSDGATSLQATIQRESTPTSLPVITIPDKDALKTHDYRQRIAERLAEIILYTSNYLGTDRLYIP